MTNNNVPSHVPKESRKKISNYLERVRAEWKSDNSTTHSDDDKIFSALTQTKRGYPAIWVGPNDGKAILPCRGKSEIWDLSLRKPIYEDGKRILVGIEGEDVEVLVYIGDMYATFPDSPPDYDVIWVVSEEGDPDRPSFGEVVEM